MTNLEQEFPDATAGEFFLVAVAFIVIPFIVLYLHLKEKFTEKN